MLLNTIRVFVKCSSTLNASRCIVNQNWQFNIGRFYSHYSSRQPVSIVNEDELFDVPDDDNLKEQIVKRQHRRRIKERKYQKKIAQATQTTPLEDKKMFTKLHENEKLLTPIIFKVKSKSKKLKEHKMILEGHRLMADAIEAGIIPEIIIFNQKSLLDNLPNLDQHDTKYYKVPYKTIQLWSSVTTSPGLMGVFPMPKMQTEPKEYIIPLTIICDNIRDPGNMGSILRTAAAVGCQKVILSKGCVDIWDQKVLRSGAGAHFKLAIQKGVEWEEMPSLIDSNSDVFAADNITACDAEALDTEELEKSLELENELEEYMEESGEDQPEYKTDNTIASREKDSEEFSGNEENDNDTNEQSSIKPKMKFRDFIKSLKKSIPVVPYYFVNYTSCSTVLIVGGETEGLTVGALKFLKNAMGARVNIPVNNNIESLNTGIAFGIVAYEISRQHAIKDAKEYNNENDDTEKETEKEQI